MNFEQERSIVYGKSEGIIIRKYTVAVIVLGMLILAGCSVGSSPEKQLAATLDEMNDAEKVYENAQKELTDQEKAEQQLFHEIMELTQEEKSELETKVKEIQGMLEDRLTYIEEEEAAMKKAMESIDKFDAIIDTADESEKEMLQQLKTTVNERYELHADFVSAYTDLTGLQKRLYEMLLEEGTDLTELTRQVEEVNAQNDVVKSAVDIFNEATVSVNNLKEDVLKRLEED